MVNATPRPLNPRERSGTHCTGGWVGPVWTGAENLAPTVNRSPDRPARSESLYRLRYPGLFASFICSNIFSSEGLYIMFAWCINVFHIIVSINNDDFPKHHWPVELCNGDWNVCCALGAPFLNICYLNFALITRLVFLLLSHDQDARSGLMAPNFKQEKSHIKRICNLNRILPCKKSERYQ